jgi:hypothetical protein
MSSCVRNTGRTAGLFSAKAVALCWKVICEATSLSEGGFCDDPPRLRNWLLDVQENEDD